MKILDLITLGIALLPTIVIMALVLGNARHKREPIKKVASVFGISAFSTIPAVILELIGSVIIALVFSSVTGTNFGKCIYQCAEFMLIVGPVEEGCKFFTFKWIIFHDRDFDNTYDGVIYGAASALGFATLENLMYVFLDNDAPLETALLRAVLSVPMHAITGIVMGYYFGISKYRRYNNIQPEKCPELPAFIFSVVLHGLYDSIVSIPEIYDDSQLVNGVCMIILVAVMIFIYIMIGRTIHRAKVETHNIYNRYYYEQLDGHWQDRMGGKTSEKRPRFFGMPIPFYYGRQPGFNVYNPYAGMNLAPVPVQPQAYVYGTQQPYNPYYQQPVQQYPRQPNYGQQPYYQNQPAPQQPYYGAPQQPSDPRFQPRQPDRGFDPRSNTYGQTVMNSAPAPNPQPQQPVNGMGMNVNAPNVNTPNVPPPQPQQPAAPPVYCGNCGAKQKPGTKYCSFCGSRIDSE